MLYIRLGINWGKWSLRDSLNNGFSMAQPGSGSKNRPSFVPGFGIETAVHRHVYLRVEYVYEFGPGVRATNGALPNRFTNMGTLRTQSGKLGVSYKF
jgi:opacity protein-like surface antigen